MPDSSERYHVISIGGEMGLKYPQVLDSEDKEAVRFGKGEHQLFPSVEAAEEAARKLNSNEATPREIEISFY